MLDAYAAQGRQALRDAGATEAGLLYERMFHKLCPGAHIDIVYPADDDSALPTASELDAYDGLAWTGSSLTIHDEDDPSVARQIEFARTAYACGLPSFGSCWAVQLAVVAAGGRCARHPRGREFGISRRIELASQARHHPLFRDKPRAFDAFTSHEDHVIDLGPAERLAGNDWSPVQAVSISHAGGSFWALQYHPEYDLHEVASLCRLRRDELVEQRTFANAQEADRFVRDFEALHAKPGDLALAEALGLGHSLLDPDIRTIEARNWIEYVASGRN